MHLGNLFETTSTYPISKFDFLRDIGDILKKHRIQYKMCNLIKLLECYGKFDVSMNLYYCIYNVTLCKG